MLSWGVSSLYASLNWEVVPNQVYSCGKSFQTEQKQNSNVTQFFFNYSVPDYYYLTVIVTYEETFTELCSYFIYKIYS